MEGYWLKVQSKKSKNKKQENVDLNDESIKASIQHKI